MRKIEKKSVSPIVATVLLISIVVVLALIIFLWARGFVSEKVQKFGSAVEFACEDVNFEAGYFKSEGKLDLINRGNVPVYGLVIKEVGAGTVRTSNEDLKNIFGNTLNIGESTEVDINVDLSTRELLVVPIILGSSGGKRVAYTCDDAFGYPVAV